MTCTPFKNKDGKVIAIVCTRGDRGRRCRVPGCDRRATKQCDYPVTSHKSGTCDMYLCDAHATTKGPDLDHCPAHARVHQQQELFAP